MDALEAHRVHEVRRVADDQGAVEEQLRLRVPAALGQGLGAVAHHLAAVENAADERMQLEVLEGGVRIEQRIAVVETDDEADRDAAVAHGVEPAAAELLLAQRIAQRVNDRARLQAIRRDVPEFLDADRVLRGSAGRGQSAASRCSCLVRLPRTPSAKIVTLAWMSAPGSNAPFGLPSLPMPLVAGANTDHTRAVAVQHMLPWKPPEQIDALGFDLLGQPLGELAERDDVVAVIAETAAA